MDSPESIFTEFGNTDEGNEFSLTGYLFNQAAKDYLLPGDENESPEIKKLRSETSSEERAIGNQTLNARSIKEILAHNERQLAKIEAANTYNDIDNSL